MGMLAEFRAFAMRGNVLDMAVGIVIGAAFAAIIGRRAPARGLSWFES